jgi:hypothetical protein
MRGQLSQRPESALNRPVRAQRPIGTTLRPQAARPQTAVASPLGLRLASRRAGPHLWIKGAQGFGDVQRLRSDEEARCATARDGWRATREPGRGTPSAERLQCDTNCEESLVKRRKRVPNRQGFWDPPSSEFPVLLPEPIVQGRPLRLAWDESAGYRSHERQRRLREPDGRAFEDSRRRPAESRRRQSPKLQSLL